MNATVSETDLDALNALLRGEIAAVETYTQAIRKFENEQVIAELQAVRDEHSRAVRILRDQIAWFGGTPAHHSGVWGTVAAVVTGTAKVLGPATVLAALRQGEEHGLAKYDDALANENVHPDSLLVIRTELLPACAVHVSRLDALIDVVGR